jgi:hypothetical protein
MWFNRLDKPQISTDYYFKDTYDFSMDSQQIIQGKKRNLGYMTAQELAYKLKSKEDFIVYFDRHRK